MIVLEELLQGLVDKGGSDLHITAGSPPKYRIDGELVDATSESLEPADTKRLVYSVLSAEQIARYEKEHELDLSFGIAGLGRFRTNAFMQRGAVAGVFRMIPYEIQGFEELGLPRKVCETLCAMPKGLILVTGATGSGKSTTLAAMIDEINRTQRKHVVTIEDPIEFIFPPAKSLVIQREVGSDTKSFQSALRSVLRQDPNCIMVGELRDRESMDICLKAAETGHTVITTVHTVDARRTIGRLIGLFPAEEQASVRLRLAESLVATISLRLVKAVGGGMLPAVEIMRMTRSIQECIKDPAKLDEMEHHIGQARELGCQTFDQHLLELVRAERISEATALLHASNPGDLKRALAFG